MKIALDWLSDFVEWPSTDELIDGLTGVGIEVEDVQDPARSVSGVVVAEVRSMEKHPKADKLNVCEVHDGSASHTVVCGAANVAAGQRVALARVGAKLGDFEIGSRKLRGVTSSGMICSRSELGLEAKSEGIWVLPVDATLGQPIFEAFPVSTLIEISVTPNRPDLLSHAGVAREVAARFATKVTHSLRRPAGKGPPADSQARVLIEDQSGCRRYLARVITGVKVGPSPDWLRARLERIGQRSINNIVDATNYVLMELGHPLHAFDLSRIRAEGGLPTVKVRRAAAGETLVTLDDVERTLNENDLVIADAETPIALAGVMGGANSEVNAGTTSVLLESAWFDPARVRSTAKRFGLHTEASHRFERGADPGIVARAADRCAQLIVEIAGGEVAQGMIDVTVKAEPKPDIRFRLDRAERILGVSLKSETVVKLLEPLEIRCTRRHEGELHFEAPTFRPDIVEEIDLIEEVARRHGYDAIEDTLPNAGGRWVHEPEVPRAYPHARHALLAHGVNEAVTYGFGSPSRFAPWAAQEGEPIRLLNPLGEELSALRTTLIPGLLDGVARNIRQGQKSVRLFELGATFHPKGTRSTGTGAPPPRPESDERGLDAALPVEERRIGIALWGERDAQRWYGSGTPVDFSDLAGILDSLFARFRLPVERVVAERVATNPYATAELRSEGLAIGWAGQLHPAVLAPYGIEGLVFAAEISLTALERVRGIPVRANPLPKFPATRRDVAVLAPRTLASAELARYLSEEAGGALGASVVEQVRLFDVYAGKGIPEDRVSLAFAIEYRHPSRTLTDDEVTEAFSAAVAGLVERFGVEIRQ
ncbi:MAG: phenylalanine--tRNA ligase subunit beta [Myxococcota bacterium]